MRADFDEIYRLYAQDVFRFLLKLCGNRDIAEDMLSETFYRAVKNIGNFKGNCKMKVWLCSIAKNAYLDYLRKSERKNISIDNQDFPDGTDIVLHTENRETTMSVHKALHSLGEPYREVFSLRIMGELSFKEIGRLFGKSDGWARVVFFRAKEKIVDILNGKDECI